MGPDGPKWGQEDFFLLIQTLPTFWAERILILRILIFWICLDSKFPDFQVPRFPGPQKSGLGRALGRAWAGPVGLGSGRPSGGPFRGPGGPDFF